MTSTIPTTRTYDEVDLSSRAFWASTPAERERRFAILRADRPVSWHRPAEAVLLPYPDDPGFWAVTSHADIVEVSRRNDVFSSSQGVHFDNVPEEMMESISFLGMDEPKHTKLRKLVSVAFTPKQVRNIEDQIKAEAKTVVRELAEAGDGADFVRHCASQLPIRTLAHMVGISAEERGSVADAAEAMISVADPAFLDGRNPLEVLFGAQTVLYQTAIAMAVDRRARPRDDLMTSLVQAEVDGERLTDEEIGAFFLLLSVAGNDTTRQTTSHALKALTDFPAQREWLIEDFDGRINGAVEEFVRWATPVMTFRRTAIADFELNGQQIRRGERVVMIYSSANWDTDVFTDPDSFDLSRSPNPHVAFGGGGAHFCLGNQVAKAQLRAIFWELLTQLPDIQAGEPERLHNSFINAIRAMPCTFSA
jgi:cytochrome P450